MLRSVLGCLAGAPAAVFSCTPSMLACRCIAPSLSAYRVLTLPICSCLTILDRAWAQQGSLDNAVPAVCAHAAGGLFALNCG